MVAWRVEGFTTKDTSSYELPRIRWSYWHDANLPRDIAEMLEQQSAALPSWDHRILHETTLGTYIDRSAFPKGYESLKPQHKADWIRLYVLQRYGGCWMDASIILYSDKEVEELYEESVRTNSELTAYSAEKNYVETFFLLAPLHSPVLRAWYEEFTEAIEIGFPAYKKKVVSRIDVSNCFDNEADTYLTTSAAIQYVLRVLLPGRPTVLRDRATSVYKYHEECRYNNSCIFRKIRDIPVDEQPSMIKLTRFNRTFYGT
jgi:hypothetical protein